jgi:hypothetical protein
MTTYVERLPRRRSDVALTDAATRSVLVTATGEQLLLNPTARAVWDLCDGDTTVEEVVAAVRTVFAVSADAAKDDVHRVVEDFLSAGIVEWPLAERGDSR